MSLAWEGATPLEGDTPDLPDAEEILERLQPIDSDDPALASLDRRVIEAVSEADREWFAAHPGGTHLFRPFTPGELACTFSGVPVENRFVCVTQIEPGFRMRQAYVVRRDTG